MTQSGFAGGRLRLEQGVGGHRAGADAALLAAAAPRSLTGLLLDAGAGAGAVGLSAALCAPSAQIGLIEVEPRACALARKNIDANDLGRRAVVFEVDLLDGAARRAVGLANETAQCVLTNPPYLSPENCRISPDARRALAHVRAAPLDAWVRAALALLAPGGLFAMIHRADALADCLTPLAGRLGDVTVLPVAPRAGENATRILLKGVKGSRAPLKLCPPLVLHQTGGAFTPLADAIFRGEAPAPF